MTFKISGVANLSIRSPGDSLKIVENFKYLAALTQSTESDIAVRNALAWNACHKSKKVLKIKLSKKTN